MPLVGSQTDERYTTGHDAARTVRGAREPRRYLHTMHSPSTSTRRALAGLAALTLAVTLDAPLAAQADLKDAVTILGASPTNDTLALPVPLGDHASIVVVVKTPQANHPNGALRVGSFATSEQPPTVAGARIREGTSDLTDSVAIKLDTAAAHEYVLQFDVLRPGKTYVGQIFLTADGLVQRWTVTITTRSRGTIGVQPVGVLRFAVVPFLATGTFDLTLYDKSESGPYHNVNARFEPAASANSKALMSNFTLGTFSFTDRAGTQPLDLAMRGDDSKGGRSGVTLARSRTLTARLGPLSPGEYGGALQFGADEAADGAPDAKLPVSILVRHYWVLPILVIILASGIGWFTSKFVVGARKTSDLARQVKELRGRADFVARPSARAGWEFPDEAGSLGFARLRVSLNKLARLTHSVMTVLLRGDEIAQLLDSATIRLVAIERLREVRLMVQPIADGRPTAQLTIGRLLREATNIVEPPTFDATAQTRLAAVLDAVQGWANETTRIAAYKQALLDRLRSNECPKPEDLQALASGHAEIATLVLPKEDVIQAATIVPALQDVDEQLVRALLAWRDREAAWASALFTAIGTGRPLNDLFDVVDRGIWDGLQLLKVHDRLRLQLDATIEGRPKIFQLVEMSLVKGDAPDADPPAALTPTTTAPPPVAVDLQQQARDEATMARVTIDRIRRHPLHVQWRIKPPSSDARTTDTHELTLVQYFPACGRADITATLLWAGQKIELPKPLEFTVVDNPEYGKRGLFRTEWTEAMAIAGAMLFAIVTAMGTLYDSTFGSLSQYLTLFAWAAGAGTGGNLFNQLGTTNAPGGRTDTALR